MTKEQIKEFVQEWMNSHEEDTFIKNEHGVVLYSSGHTSLNLTCFFEDLLTEFIESEIERLKAEREWISVEDRLPEDNETVLVTNGQRVKEVWFGQRTKLDRPHFMFTTMPLHTITHWMPLPKPPKQ